MKATEREKLKENIAYVSRFYGLSPESEQMAYIAAQHSKHAGAIYQKIRESIEKEDN